MADPFIGQISMVGFKFAPEDCALCQGQTLAIQDHTALFSLINTYYGGNGTSTFQLPDLRGRTPISYGDYIDPYNGDPENYNLGSQGGFESVTLNANTMPQHTHRLAGTAENGTAALGNNGGFAVPVMSGSTSFSAYTNSTNNLTSLSPQALPTSAGGGDAHDNMQPTLIMNFIIALDGTYPSRN